MILVPFPKTHPNQNADKNITVQHHHRKRKLCLFLNNWRCHTKLWASTHLKHRLFDRWFEIFATFTKFCPGSHSATCTHSLQWRLQVISVVLFSNRQHFVACHNEKLPIWWTTRTRMVQEKHEFSESMGLYCSETPGDPCFSLSALSPGIADCFLPHPMFEMATALVLALRPLSWVTARLALWEDSSLRDDSSLLLWQHCIIIRNFCLNCWPDMMYSRKLTLWLEPFIMPTKNHIGVIWPNSSTRFTSKSPEMEENEMKQIMFIVCRILILGLL